MDIGERPLLSIIIPSRDNVEALFVHFPSGFFPVFFYGTACRPCCGISYGILISVNYQRIPAISLTYDEWIRQQEEKVNISTIKIIREKRLTNDSEKLSNESAGNENELEISKKEEFPRLFEILDESSQFFRGTMTLLYCTVSPRLCPHRLLQGAAQCRPSYCHQTAKIKGG